MNGLETQVGQIFISDKRLSKSFVSLLSERVPETNAEIFSLVEIPVLNPAAWAEYEKLAKMLQTILRRNFRRENGSAFENAIAQINDELAKQAASGQTAWVGKMNACLAVRQEESLYIATCGKVHSYLFRDKQFADISDSPEKPNPLKTFENFAVGKILKKDFLIFSTTQLFNYISVERLKDILTRNQLAPACQNIAEIIRNLADESISFGTFILEFGGSGAFGTEQILSFSLPINQNSYKETVLALGSKAMQFSSASFSKLRNVNWSGGLSSSYSGLRSAKQKLNYEKFKSLPRAKKFFLASAGVFALILIINLFVAIHVRGVNKRDAQINAVLTDAQNKINEANSAYIYSDKQHALEILGMAKTELSNLPAKTNFEAQKTKLVQQITELQNSIGGLKNVSAAILAKFDGADRLKLAGNKLVLINSHDGKYTIYDWGSAALGQSFTVAPQPQALNSIDNNIYFTDSSGNIYQLDTDRKQASQLAAKVPGNADLAAFYGSPTKIYALYRSSKTIDVAALQKQDSPTAYLKEGADISGAVDFTIDGSVYILFKNSISKFTQGVQKPFSNIGLAFSDRAKIFTDLNVKNIYILDPGQNRLIVLDKNGSVKAQYTSDKFSDLKDFVVDEANKTVYILNGSELLKIGM